MVASAAAALMLLSAPAYRQQFPLPSLTVGDGWGVNIHFTREQPGELAKIASLGFKWIRMDFAWAGIEREKGRYDFGAFDKLLDDCDKHGLRALLILDYGNDLYQKGAPSTPEARAAFARFAQEGVKRFKGRGVLWEIWNEPNILPFWPPSPKAEDYIALSRETARAIRQAAPDEWIVGPATSGFDWTFLEACFRAGLLQDFDAVSVHPYRQQAPETAAGDWARLRALTARYAPKGKEIPLLSGEWGYSDVWPGYDQNRQAAYAVRQHLANLASGVPLSIYYDWKNDGTDPKEPEHHFGLVDHQLGDKPGAKAVRLAIQELRGYEARRLVSFGGAAQGALLQKGGQLKIAAWNDGPMDGVSFSASLNQAKRLSSDGEVEQLGQAGSMSLTPSPLFAVVQPSDDVLGALALMGPSHGIRPIASLAEAERAAAQVLQRLGQLSSKWKDAQLVWTDPADPSRRVTARPSAKPDPAAKPESAAKEMLRQIGAAWVAGSPVALEAAANGPAGRTVLATLDLRPADQVSLSLAPGGRLVEVSADRQVLVGLAGLAWRCGSKSGQIALPSEGPLLLPLPPESSASPWELIHKGQRVAALRAGTEAMPLITPGGSGAYRALLEGDPDRGGTTSAESAGPQAIRVKYSFGEGWQYLLLVTDAPGLLERQGKAPIEFCAWIHGDGSGNSVRMRFEDSSGQTFQQTWGPLDWKGGRRLMRVPLSADGAGSWGGPADGIVRHPIRIQAMLCVDSISRKAHQGEVVIEAPTVVFAPR